MRLGRALAGFDGEAVTGLAVEAEAVREGVTFVEGAPADVGPGGALACFIPQAARMSAAEATAKVQVIALGRGCLLASMSLRRATADVWFH